jgi:predicted DCC family thiol-disulfide oxidoreductase YuxK
MSDETCPVLSVYYDGACPLCQKEMAVYRSLLPLDGVGAVDYVDVRDAATPLPEGSTRGQLMARFHVRRANGEWLSGAAAFLALWARLPGWRYLAWMGHLPGAPWLMERAYRWFLRHRPKVQRWLARQG